MVLQKFVAASLDSMVRRISLAPATFLPAVGTMNGSPAALRSDSYGIFGLLVRTISGMPVILKSALVAFFISFSIHEPEG